MRPAMCLPLSNVGFSFIQKALAMPLRQPISETEGSFVDRLKSSTTRTWRLAIRHPFFDAIADGTLGNKKLAFWFEHHTGEPVSTQRPTPPVGHGSHPRESSRQTLHLK